MGASDHPDHPALARRLQDCLRWRNAHARHPGVLAAQRRERARSRTAALTDAAALVDEETNASAAGRDEAPFRRQE